MITYETAYRLFSELEKRIVSARKKESVFNALKSFLYGVLFFASSGFLLIFLEAVFGFSSSVRTVFYWSYSLSLFTTFIYVSIRLLLSYANITSKFDIVKYSARIGRALPSVSDSITNAVSLFKSCKKGEKNIYSEELIYTNLNKVTYDTRNIDLSSFISFRKLVRSLLVLLAVFSFIILSFAAFYNPLSASVYRIINYNYGFIDNLYGISFEVSPGDYETFSGNDVPVVIRVNTLKEGLKIDDIEFTTHEFTNDGVEVNKKVTELKANIDGSFSAVIKPYNNSVYYFASFKGISSKEYKISLADYPLVKSFTVTVSYPPYTGLPPKTLGENEGDITCPEGSNISFKLLSSKELSYAAVEFNGGEFPLNINGDEADGSISASMNGSYRFILRDTENRIAPASREYKIRILENQPPKIVITLPVESDYKLFGEKEILLRAQITDDYGFSRLVLGYRKIMPNSTASSEFSVLAVPVKNLDATSLDVPYLWNILALRLSPGSSVEYYMEVTDNTGNSSRSNVRTLSYNSLSDQIKKTEKTADEIQSDIKSVMENMKTLKEDLREISKNTDELGINEQKRKELQSRIEDVQKNLQDVQRNIDDGINQLQQNNTLSEKTLEQFMKLQELFNKINTPEFRKMLEKLQEALKKNNMEQLRRELDQMNFDEEAFKKQLEQVMELMKKIENLQKLGELTQKLDEITKNQEQLKNLTEQTKQEETSKLNTLADKQKTLQEELKKFREAMRELIDKMNQTKDEVSTENLQELMKKLDTKKTNQKMQKSSSDLFKGNKEQSEGMQEEILDDLNEMNDMMQDALEMAMDSKDMMKKMMDKMKEIKKNLDELSEDQKDLQDETKDLDNRDNEEFNEAGKEQRELQQRLTQSIEDIMGLTRSGVQITPDMGKELGNAYNKMDKAGRDLDAKQKQDAVNNQGKAKESIDKASKMLGDMISEMAQQNSKGKKPGEGRMGMLMQRLAQLIGQQQGVTGRINKLGENGKLGRDGKGTEDGLTQEQREQIDRLKLEQEQIRKSLEQLAEEFEKEKERSGEKLLGDLNEIQKQMQESIRDMSEYNIDDRLVERQNRILSRLLDAQLSQREKDFEQKRESKPGENVSRLSPPEIILSGPRSLESVKEDFLRLQNQGYTDDYEELIMKYLTALREKGY